MAERFFPDAMPSPMADTITLPQGDYELTIPGASEDGATSGDLDLSGDLTLQGEGAARTVIDGGSIDRVLDVLAGAAVSISDITAAVVERRGVRTDALTTPTERVYRPADPDLCRHLRLSE